MGHQLRKMSLCKQFIQSVYTLVNVLVNLCTCNPDSFIGNGVYMYIIRLWHVFDNGITCALYMPVDVNCCSLIVGLLPFQEFNNKYAEKFRLMRFSSKVHTLCKVHVQ